jgi:hypothetical protein
MNTPLNSWIALILPPERYEPIEVCLPDDTVQRGVWTGAQWCAEGRQVNPKAWRPFQRATEFELEVVHAT